MIIKNFHSLATTALRKKALQIINSGLEAINTQRVIKQQIKLSRNYIIIKNKKINLAKYKKIVVIGFGKASSLMAKELEKILKNKISGGIVISTKKIKLKKIKVIKGTHPLPSQNNIDQKNSCDIEKIR
jgi:glycerate-2-kinase